MSTPEDRPPLVTPPVAPAPELAPLIEPEADAAPDSKARATRTRAASPSEGSSTRPGGRKKRRASTQRADTRPARAPRTREASSTSRVLLAKGLEETLQGIAIAVSIIDAEDGAIIARGEPRLTAALVATAEQNPRFKARLEALLEGGTYMQLAVAVGAIALPITMRHVPVPPQLRSAAALMQSRGEQAPDAPPAEWSMPGEAPTPGFVAADGTVLYPGVAYRDEGGAYTIDDAGNVITLDESSGDDTTA